MTRRPPHADDLRERIRALPGADRLLPALQGLPPAFLVGGAVRDLLLGARSVDLDVAIEGDAVAAGHELAERLGAEVVAHERFGTSTLSAGDLSLDLASTRRERYPAAGALPEVDPAPLHDDLERRDFTINAMAAGLTGEDLGRLYDLHGGAADLEARVVRVLHEGSFLDDPTRILRAVRYEARLGFRMVPETERLAREAIRVGALATVSGARVRDALLDLLAEQEIEKALTRLGALGIDRALDPALELDEAAVKRAGAAALGAIETGADRALAALAALVHGRMAELTPWVEGLDLGAAGRDAVMRAAFSAPMLKLELRAQRRSPSMVHRLLAGEPPETLALALAIGAPAEPILRFQRELRDVRLEIGGRDLVEAGIPESPAIGRALDAVLRRKLDGEVSGREQELALALELARAERAER